jgi:prepilin-type N-terminal cleavage/methylation domain-containing protein
MSMHARGFTLIELMIAMALGVFILLVAFAAIRGTERAYQKAVAAREVNALMADGYRSAMTEMDRWIAIDDPDLSAGQSLRAAGYAMAPLSLPDAAYRVDPSDPRWWDCSGMRAMNIRYRNQSDSWHYWPDHAQVAGINFQGDSAHIHNLQNSLWARGQLPLLLAYTPGHLPLGAIDAHRGWYNASYSGDRYATPMTWAQNGMSRALIWRTKDTRHWDRGDYQAGFSSARFGTFQYSKKAFIAPREGWSGVNTASNTLYQDIGSNYFKIDGERLMNDFNQNSLIWQDRLQAAAGSPAFRGGDSGRFGHRFRVDRYYDSDGFTQTASITVQDNETGALTTLGFRPLATDLRGARLSRGLDQ